MSVLNIGIVEDELVIARTIANTLKELGYSCVGPAINFTEAIQMLEVSKPDLVLLDIQLAGKKDGIELAEFINETCKIPFIFLTANSDAVTVARAKNVRPHAFIVKPFTREELFATIEIAFNNFNSMRPEKSIQTTVIDHTVRDYLFVRDGYIFKKIHFNELLYLESDANYLVLHLGSQKKIIIRSTLQDFTSQLDPKRFARIHRSFSVNIDFIDDVHPTEIGINGVKIPLGRSYRNELFTLLGITDVE
jgi:DNA-binding LytR/AlgR family response regulator